MEKLIRMKTVKIINRLLKPLAEEGVVKWPEYREIHAQLKNLAEKGDLRPILKPKLISQAEAAEMLGISLANFKKLERNGVFGFGRRNVGSSVRYRNSDVLDWIMQDDDAQDQS